MEAHKHTMKLRNVIHMNKMKLLHPNKNILNNVSISKALRNDSYKFKNYQTNCSLNARKSYNIYNNSVMMGANEVISHRPLA